MITKNRFAELLSILNEVEILDDDGNSLILADIAANEFKEVVNYMNDAYEYMWGPRENTIMELVTSND